MVLWIAVDQWGDGYFCGFFYMMYCCFIFVVGLVEVFANFIHSFPLAVPLCTPSVSNYLSQ